MKIRSLSILLTVIFLIPAFAYSADDGLCKQGVVVVFGNGVWNDREGADRSRRLLAWRLESHISGTDLEDLITNDTAHNPSDGKLLDLVETFEQNLQTDWSQFWRYLAGLDPMPDFIQDKLIEIANTVDENVLQANPAVQDHVDKYNEYLSKGNKVVVVAHSQGNLFANIAYPGIYSEYIDSFGIVSVGNPDNYVAGNGPYTTLDEDIIIGSVPGSLSANIDNFLGINLKDLTGHMFEKSYMESGRPAETKILDDIETMIFNLKQPPGNSELFIDFETLPDGTRPTVVDYHSNGYPGSPILDSYADFGVHFSQTGTDESPAFSNYQTGNNISAFVWRNVNGYSDLIISFDCPVYSIKADVSGAADATITMTAQDINGNHIGADSAFGFQPYIFAKTVSLEISTPIISQIKFTTQQWRGIHLDNLHLNEQNPNDNNSLKMFSAPVERNGASSDIQFDIEICGDGIDNNGDGFVDEGC